MVSIKMDINVTLDTVGWFENATTEIPNRGPSSINSSQTFSWSFYFSIFLIWIPGIFTNALALYFMIKDIRKAVFPAIILLLVLCGCDLTAVCFSALKHFLTRYMDVTYIFCGFLTSIHIFFKISSGVLNCMMAVDRVLAICTPFYYKRNVDVNTWKIGCLCAGVAIACFCCFPLIGLGDFMAVRGGGRVVCSSLSYRTVPVERVFGVMFGCIGFACIFTIVVCNMLVVRALVRLNNRIVSITTTSDTLTSTTDGSSDGSSAAKVTSYEVTFAKLMGALAAVYLVCGTPYNTLMLMQQFNVRFDPSITGYIHLLAGFIYTIDPIVYILVRKTSRKRIAEMLCNSCCMGEDTLKA